MIDIEKLKAQIMKNLNRVEFEKARKQQKEKDIIGGYAKEFADAVLKSDIRMYKREIFAFNGKYYENFGFAIFRNIMIEMLLDLNAGYGLIVKNNIDLVEFCKTRLIMKDINPNRNFIPFQNYVAWFLISLTASAGLIYLKSREATEYFSFNGSNVFTHYFIVQIIFFSALNFK